MNLPKNDFIPLNTVQCYSVREQGSKVITVHITNSNEESSLSVIRHDEVS